MSVYEYVIRMPGAIIDASTAPPDLLARRMLGVPLVLWPLRALSRFIPAERIGLITGDPGILGLASKHGLQPLRPSPAARNEFAVVADPLQPFILEDTVRRAFNASRGAVSSEAAPESSKVRLVDPLSSDRGSLPTRLPDFQSSLVERVRVEDEESFEFAAALARGLPPDHPAIRGIARLRLPLGADVRLVVCDVDGTLTDGGIALNDSAGALRAFHTHDGLGTRMLLDAGIKVAWISATSRADSIHERAAMLGITHVDAGEGAKGPRFAQVCRLLGVDPRNALFLGDDVNDLPAMRQAGLSACPADARPEVRARVDLVLDTPGGRGAFRELADILLAGR